MAAAARLSASACSQGSSQVSPRQRNKLIGEVVNSSIRQMLTCCTREAIEVVVSQAEARLRTERIDPPPLIRDIGNGLANELDAA
jgi:hypothetical protein